MKPKPRKSGKPQTSQKEVKRRLEHALFYLNRAMFGKMEPWETRNDVEVAMIDLGWIQKHIRLQK